MLRLCTKLRKTGVELYVKFFHKVVEQSQRQYAHQKGNKLALAYRHPQRRVLFLGKSHKHFGYALGAFTVPFRPLHLFYAMLFASETFAFFIRASVKPVDTSPGITVHTAIFLYFNSVRKARAKFSIAALLAE